MSVNLSQGTSPAAVEAEPRMSTPRALIASMRPPQWAKNVFLLAGIVFANKLGDRHDVAVALGAFAAFCALSSSAYLTNDIFDAERDRLHPVKRRRGIASGALSVRVAGVAATILGLAGLGGAFALGWKFGLCAAAYYALSMAYTVKLKHVLFVDVIALSLFYVIRAGAGAIAISVPVSPWLLLCTTLLALFIGVTKRRHELLVLGGDAAGHRGSLAEYSAALLDQMVSLLSSSVLVSYALYTFFSDHPHKSLLLVATFPFVVYALFRFLYLTYRKEDVGSPEDLILTDKPLALCVALWGVTALGVLYWR